MNGWWINDEGPYTKLSRYIILQKQQENTRNFKTGRFNLEEKEGEEENQEREREKQQHLHYQAGFLDASPPPPFSLSLSLFGLFVCFLSQIVA